MSVTELGTGYEPIPDDPLTPPRRFLGDYIDEYTRICEQILVLKNQIDMLNTNRQRLEIAAFDQHIHQLCVELCKSKAEIEPIALLLCEVISQMTLKADKESFIEHVILKHSTREIARDHNVTNQTVLSSLNRCRKIQVPESMVEKYGKILKK